MRDDNQEWFEAFERGNRFEKHQALVRMPLHAGVPANSKVRRFLEKMTLCGLGWKDIRLPNGRVVRRRNFCNQPLCPKCRPFVVKRDADRGWQRFVDAIGSDIDASDFSFVSVNGSVIDPSDPRHTRRTSDRRIKRYLEQLGSPLLCYGRYELTRRDDRQLRLDWHFVCYHPNIDRQDLANHLRVKFPEGRAVNVTPIRGGNAGLKTNLKTVLCYSGKMHVSGTKAKNENIGDVIDLISTYEKIRSTGLKGIRFEFGFRSWLGDVDDDEDVKFVHSYDESDLTNNHVCSVHRDIANVDQCGSVSSWSLNYAPYRKLVHVLSVGLHTPDPSGCIYPDKGFQWSDHFHFSSQARGPPIRGDPPEEGNHSASVRYAENPCGLPLWHIRISAGLLE
jgi:hypothetical protein